jgi:predicted nuclease of predicted toxin-antitoxin system
MALAFLLDENLRGPLWRAIEMHNRRGSLPLDAIRVGDVGELPLGAPDAEVLAWADRANRILVSHDCSTLPEELVQRLARGEHCPGILLLRRSTRISAIVQFLVLAAYASGPEEWADRIEYVDP